MLRPPKKNQRRSGLWSRTKRDCERRGEEGGATESEKRAGEYGAHGGTFLADEMLISERRVFVEFLLLELSKEGIFMRVLVVLDSVVVAMYAPAKIESF